MSELRDATGWQAIVCGGLLLILHLWPQVLGLNSLFVGVISMALWFFGVAGLVVCVAVSTGMLISRLRKRER